MKYDGDKDNEDPRVVDPRKRLSTESIQSASTLNTLATESTWDTRLPPAVYNFGREEEDLLALDAAEMSEAFASTDSGRMAELRLENVILPRNQAKTLNQNTLRAQNEHREAEIAAAQQAELVAKRKKRKNRMLFYLSLAIFASFAAVGLIGYILTSEEASDGTDENSVDSPTSPPSTSRLPLLTIVPTISPTQSLSKLPTPSPTISPIVSITFSPTSPGFLSFVPLGVSFSNKSAKLFCNWIVDSVEICEEGRLRLCDRGKLKAPCNSCLCEGSSATVQLLNTAKAQDVVETLSSAVKECQDGSVQDDQEGCVEDFFFVCNSESNIEVFLTDCSGEERCVCEGNVGSYCLGEVECK